MKRRGRKNAVFFDGDQILAAWQDVDSSEASLQISQMVDDGEMLEGEITLVLPGVEAFSYITDLPSRDPDELEALIGHEFERRFHLTDDPLVYGHANWNGLSETHSRVLLTSVPESLIDTYLSRIPGKRARIMDITTSFDALRRHFLNSAEAPDALTLVVGQYNTFADLLVLESGQPLVQRSIPLVDGGKDRLQGEIDRTLLHLESQGCTKQPEICVYGADDSAAAVLSAVLETGNSGAVIDLLPESIQSYRRRNAQLKSYAVLALSAILLFALCIGINDALYLKESRYLYFLEESTAALGSQAETLSEMMDTIEQSRKEAELQYRVLSIINEIASCVPPDAGIDFLSVESDGKVHLGGQAQERRALFAFMETLEVSALLTDVKAVSMPLRRMGNAEVVDYRLELTAGEATGP